MENIPRLISALRFEKERRIKESFNYDWESIARNNQKIPSGRWFAWLIMAGRGFGKTRTGAETVKKMALSGEYKRFCILGETQEQVRNIMLEGESGILKIHKKDEMPIYKPSKKELIWPNGAIANCYSAENYEALRGPQFDFAWVDELAKFEKAEQVWDQLMFCLRLGKAPKVVITTTPRPKKIIYQLIKRKDVHITRGTTFDNSENLSREFLNMIKEQYSNTNIGRQEIEGILQSSDCNSLWGYEDFNYLGLDEEIKDFDKVIVAIDPAATANENSDETGIMVCGKKNGIFYLLEDASGVMKPEIWAKIAFDLFKKYNASEIIVETNQGGDILIAMLNSFFAAPWNGVRAKESKLKRAQAISVLYKNKLVRHAKRFEKLEEQMIKAHLSFPDDRLDALVWGVHALMQSKACDASTFVRFW